MRPLLLFVVCWTAVAGQQPHFSARINLVQVDALVTRGGHPLAGLTASDFDLRDNGVRQTIDRISFEEVPLRVVMAVDTSASVEGEKLRDLIDASKAVVEHLRPHDEGVVLAFSADVRIAASGTGKTMRVGDLDALKAYGGTALHDAVFTALQLSRSDHARPLVLVFSDGADTFSWLSKERLRDAVRRAQVVVYCVGLEPEAGRRPMHSSDPGLDTLQRLADDSGGQLLTTRSGERLRETFVRVLTEFRQRYLISYYPTNVSSTGWHKIELRVPRGRVQVRARPGYQAQ